MKSLTIQEVFDISAGHLLKQGERSLASNLPESCAYRGEDGLKCAIGIFIPDQIYYADMEGNDVIRMFEKFPDSMELCGLEEEEHSELLMDLQSTHDSSTVDLWEGELKRIAKDYGLGYGALEGCLSG